MVHTSGRRHCARIAALLLLVPAVAAAGSPEPVAGWDGGRCQVKLEAARADGVLFLRASCPLSEGEAAKALSETLPRLRESGDSPSRYRLLFLGRLVDYPWVSEGLAGWAVRSPQWDSGKARLRSEKNINRFVANGLREAGVLAPVADVLRREGLRVTGVSAEKVLIARVSELPFGGRLQTQGIAGRARVPFDAMVHLILAPDEGVGANPN